jgi:hypothetical protein
MSGIPDNENAPPYRKFGATDHVVSAAKSDKARENRWNAVLFLIYWFGSRYLRFWATALGGSTICLDRAASLRSATTFAP